MKIHLLNRNASAALAWVFVAAFWWASSPTLTPSFQIYAKNGKPVSHPNAEHLMDPGNSLRIGYELRPDLRIGFDSRHGLGFVFDF